MTQAFPGSSGSAEQDPAAPAQSEEQIIASTRHWVDRAVIGMNLCPFAGEVSRNGRIRYVVSAASRPKALLADLTAELRLLASSPAETIETTLLIHPWVLSDFLAFNDFLEKVERAIVSEDLEGVIQVASFHPCYQFEGTAPDDIENYTNRSPYPTLHLLRESSVTEAVTRVPDPSSIYDRNIATLRVLGLEGWARALKADPPKD
jgi:uncharacterized protein